jgi:hypothetical protein
MPIWCAVAGNETVAGEIASTAAALASSVAFTRKTRQNSDGADARSGADGT